MSVLSSRQIESLLAFTTVIEPHSDQLSDPRLNASWNERLAKVEGLCFELSLGSVHVKRESGRMPFIGINSRMTPDYYDLAMEGGGSWLLMPGRYEFMTLETINAPAHLDIELFSKRTPVTAGIDFQFNPVCPGYSGKLTVGATVADNYWLRFERGGLFMAMKFHTIADADGVNLYGGIWSGDKVTTDGMERAR